MDPDAFDRLARVMSCLTTRRLAMLIAPSLGLAGLVKAPHISEAGKNSKKKRKKKKCKKQRKTICNGKCGIVKDKCKKKIDCGACPDGQCCSGEGACGACLAFVSSATHDGDFDGLSGADAFCESLAAAAGLPGEYLAWLSDSTHSPSTRFVQATVPYALVDGSTIAEDWSALTSGALGHPINLTESGLDGGQQNVWTNTLPEGTPGGIAADGDCQAWTATFGGETGNTGLSSSTDGSWTRFSNHGCGDAPRRLYCFQQR